VKDQHAEREDELQQEVAQLKSQLFLLKTRPSLARMDTSEANDLRNTNNQQQRDSSLMADLNNNVMGAVDCFPRGTMQSQDCFSQRASEMNFATQHNFFENEAGEYSNVQEDFESS